MKVGDYVTYSDEFLIHFNCEKFHLKIIKIDDNIAYLNESITITRNDNTYYEHVLNSLHMDYLILDTKYIRKLKLKKLNDL